MRLSKGSIGFLVVLVLLGVAAAAGITFLRSGGLGGGGDAEGGPPVTVVIPEGVGTNQVAAILEDQGVIENALLFRFTARSDSRSSRIRPGTYQLTPGMETGEILAVLSAAPPAVPTFAVTIPEGLTVAQTLERIATAPGSAVTVEQLAAALPQVPRPTWALPVEQIPQPQPYPGLTPYEGLLFPDTYEFRQDQQPASILQELMDRTQEVMATVTPPPNLDLYEVLIVGSLIEREARVPDEQARISSVIHNRLAVPRELQVDAAVLYALASNATQVLNEDLQVPSPWNTYDENNGVYLPPTPISGAGEGAIRAAAAPEQTAFLFYVVCDQAEGRHAFAETDEQHQVNVARFREGGGC
jgi:UPF0755 protein